MTNKIKITKTIEITNKFKVLYVEDNIESSTQALKLFDNYFAHIDVAYDGKIGLEMYKNIFLETNRYYDLVISDIEMPNLDGITMSKEIYTLNKNQHIIIVSAYSDKKYLIDLINIGIDGFLQKPLSFDQILEAFFQFSQTFKQTSIVTLSHKCTYDKLTKQFKHNDKIINLTPNEIKLIDFLLDATNINCSVKDVFNSIFYDQPYKDFTPDSIKGLIKRLRKKIPQDIISYTTNKGYSIK